MQNFSRRVYARITKFHTTWPQRHTVRGVIASEQPNLQSRDIPTARHFLKRQYWHRLRFSRMTGQWPSRRHRYSICFCMLRRKNPWTKVNSKTLSKFALHCQKWKQKSPHMTIIDADLPQSTLPLIKKIHTSVNVSCSLLLLVDVWASRVGGRCHRVWPGSVGLQT